MTIISLDESKRLRRESLSNLLPRSLLDKQLLNKVDPLLKKMRDQDHPTLFQKGQKIKSKATKEKITNKKKRSKDFDQSKEKKLIMLKNDQCHIDKSLEKIIPIKWGTKKICSQTDREEIQTLRFLQWISELNEEMNREIIQVATERLILELAQT